MGDQLHLLYAVFGVAAVVLALGGRRLRMLPVSEPLVALVLGVVVGPQVLGAIEIGTEGRDLVLLEGSRLLLAGSVMAAALRFPVAELRPLLRPLTVLVLVAMPLAAALVGAAAWLLGLPVALAVLVGACLSPTDPVLAASVVSGESAEADLPGDLRRLLTGESGANDGLALPLVGLAVAAGLPAEGPVDVVVRLAVEVVGGVAIGAVLGLMAGWAIAIAGDEEGMGRGPELLFSLLLAVAVLGVSRVAGTAEVLAVFVAGLAYNRAVGERERGTQDSIDEAVNRYAVLPLFIVLGVVAPWSGWAALGPGAAGFVVTALLLRRLPVVLALARPLGLSWRDAWFAGWFGPMGVSAVFYAAFSLDEGIGDERLFAAVTLAVVASVVAFGVTGSPARRTYARTDSARVRR